MAGGHFQEFEEEYMETLYEFHEKNPGRQVRNGELAEKMGVSPASATEMVQRLASKGLVVYEAYKGVIMTDSGLDMGRQMKRRHRLAEALLDILPFDGDIHETACRLEHAFNDDLEVCLTRILGDPKLDPSGRDIPEASPEVKSRLLNVEEMIPLHDLNQKEKAEIKIILFIPPLISKVGDMGLAVGQVVEKTPSGYSIDGVEFSLHEELGRSIIVKRC